MPGFDIIVTDRCWRMVAVRFLRVLILFVFGYYGVSAFGEETPTGQPPVPDNVVPATVAIPVDNGVIDRSHEYLDRTRQHGRT
ncbi:MAG: hypothetical protein HW377_1126 [Actinobacteria bacterium]|nr:hypothetical protein [Actinomycetota bacterium]